MRFKSGHQQQHSARIPSCGSPRQPDNPWAHFSDTDHAGNREIQNKRRSQNCYIACHRGMPVYWKSSVSSVAFACAEIGEAHADISSGAAEIYGSANASMDAMYIRYVAEECNFEFPIPIELQVDNKTAIAYHKSDVNRTKLKHIDARQEWVKMIRDKQLLRMIKVDTKLNVADLGTKILDKFTFQKLRGMLMHDLEYLCSAQQN